MISLEQFKNALLAEGSHQSAKFNTFVLGGIDGMPLTHQIGFGNYFRNDCYPDDVDMSKMEFDTHAKMGLVVAGLCLTKSTAKEHPVLAILSAGLSGYGIFEMYKDWQAGFKAANYLSNEYFVKYPSLKQVKTLTPLNDRF